MKERIKDLTEQFREIQDGRPWIGTNLSRKLRELSDEEFFRRPLPDTHSAAELISHLTAWRVDTVLKIKTGRGRLTDKDPENWQDSTLLEGKGRSTLMKDYLDSQIEILELLADKEDDFLEELYYDDDFGGHYSYSWLLRGMIQHDVYHLGQLGWIVKFMKNSSL
jgi:uncharacterized damage-inducible protein DinB